MKAAVCLKYGSQEVLQLKEVEKPLSAADEVLKRVKASTVNTADCNACGLSYIPTGLGLLAKLMM